MSGTTHTVLAVHGMSCSSCVRHVEGALKKLPGVTAVEVSLSEGRARVEHATTSPTAEQMIAALDDAGYDSKLA